MQQPKVFLASNSPRRKELLTQMGIDFKVLSCDVDEAPRKNEPAGELVIRLAKEKAQATQLQHALIASDWVIAGDTLIELDGQVLGKPANRLEAMTMLQKLSNSTHQVLSAVAVAHAGQLGCALNTTEVSFTTLETEMLETYLDSDEAYDKAGAYAIQGEAAKWISNMNGSYFAVMGLPIFELEQLLKSMNFYKK